jgi:hypothetical protein
MRLRQKKHRHCGHRKARSGGSEAGRRQASVILHTTPSYTFIGDPSYQFLSTSRASRAKPGERAPRAHASRPRPCATAPPQHAPRFLFRLLDPPSRSPSRCPGGGVSGSPSDAQTDGDQTDAPDGCVLGHMKAHQDPGPNRTQQLPANSYPLTASCSSPDPSARARSSA